MPAANQRPKSSRSTGSGRRSNGSGGTTRAASRTRQQRSTTQKRATASTASPSSNGRSNKNHSTITSIGISAAAATIGVAGGVLLGRTALQRNRKVLGVKLPVKVDLSDVGKQVGAAGREFGKLAGEVKAVRQKAEQVGRAIG